MLSIFQLSWEAKNINADWFFRNGTPWTVVGRYQRYSGTWSPSLQGGRVVQRHASIFRPDDYWKIPMRVVTVPEFHGNPWKSGTHLLSNETLHPERN